MPARLVISARFACASAPLSMASLRLRLRALANRVRLVPDCQTIKQELLLDRTMETFTDAISLWRLGARAGMTDVFDCQIQFMVSLRSLLRRTDRRW
jgi:hypothetical protein